jgi:glucosamine--fructose-6-phosphate aminotransferase (isomerizing)
MNFPTAHEISLKLKELALLLAEPYSSADFRHGPIAMAGRRLPAIVVAPRGSRPAAELDALAARLRAGRNPVVVIGPSGPGSIPLPAVPEILSPLVAVIPGQLLAFHAARVRGLDPDNPRWIRKVTETR